MNRKKRTYETPEIESVEIELVDIITTSLTDGGTSSDIHQDPFGEKFGG